RLKIQHAENVADLSDLDLTRFVLERERHYIGMRPSPDFPAGRTCVAKITRIGCIGAVERFGDHESAGVLADAFGSRKDQAMREPSFAKFSAKAIDDLAVSDEGIKLHQLKPSSVRICRWTASTG